MTVNEPYVKGGRGGAGGGVILSKENSVLKISNRGFFKENKPRPQVT